MNPSNLPPQGRYFDPGLQQMVLDELGKQGITPEKFYFTSDDWMVSPDHAWNSVFGIAAYRRDGQTFYAECGVSRPYDAASGGWADPTAAVKVGLPLNEEAFAAAPGALGSAAAPAEGATAGQDAPANPGAGLDEPSSQTVLAGAIPGVPAPNATGPESGSPLPAVPSGEEWSAADRADGQPRVEPGPGHDWQHTDAAPEPEREPVPAGEEWSSAEPVAESADLRQAGDLGVDESAAVQQPTPGTDDSAPSYESAGAEDEARQHPHPREAHLAGYALSVREDGTAELQVPLGGQVTLKWAGQ